jgi:hypothetical protein
MSTLSCDPEIPVLFQGRQKLLPVFLELKKIWFSDNTDAEKVQKDLKCRNYVTKKTV